MPSLSGLLFDLGGIGGIAAGMAGKDVPRAIFLRYYASILFDRPFSIGDWIRSPDRNISKVRSPKSAGELHELTHSTTACCTCLIPSFHPLALRIRRMTNRRIKNGYWITLRRCRQNWPYC
ncbi:hypothetical protein KCP74_17570 [Salmonella enterica subsp. enterica]|nr:hypothetical protein KCP74_17570 [Salmonella enterica subsp. enterica]